MLSSVMFLTWIIHVEAYMVLWFLLDNLRFEIQFGIA